MRHRLHPASVRDLPFKGFKLSRGQVIRRCTCGALWVTRGRATARQKFEEHLTEVKDDRLAAMAVDVHGD